MIRGIITTKEVLLHAPTIVQGFGIRAWWRCVRAILVGEQTTFLALIS